MTSQSSSYIASTSGNSWSFRFSFIQSSAGFAKGSVFCSSDRTSILMHSKVNKMRFQRLNNNKAIEAQEFEDDDEVFKTEDEEQNLNNQSVQDFSDMLTIEGLRRNYNSCSRCGVSWYDDHVSLDCSECGGYAMYRPCPTCNGQCGNMWRRDVKASHISKHAEWHGTCSMGCQWSSQNLLESKEMTEDKNANFQSSSYHRLSQNRVHEAHVM